MEFRHTGIPGLWTQELDAGLWTLDAGRWTLDAGRWTLDAGFWTLNATLRKLLSTGSEHNQNPVSDSTDSIESIGSGVAIFRNSILTLNVTL